MIIRKTPTHPLAPQPHSFYTNHMDLLWFFLGCTLLWFGGNWVVDGSSDIARSFKVSELVIGLSLVAIGTSFPEVFVNIIASLNQEPDLVIGNIIGSNISNSLLILGAASVLSPLVIPSCRLRNEIQFYYFTCILFLGYLVLAPQLTIGKLGGTLLLVLFIVAVALIFLPKPTKDDPPSPKHILPLWQSTLLLITGCALLPIGGHFLITSAIAIALKCGLSKAFISLFAVALGTSLPELVTSVIAAKKGNTEMALGNVLGSNIFNLTLVLGISAWFAPLNIASIFHQDIFIMILAALPLGFILLKTRRGKLSRFFAFSMLGSYLVYCIFIYLR